MIHIWKTKTLVGLKKEPKISAHNAFNKVTPNFSTYTTITMALAKNGDLTINKKSLKLT